MSPWQFILIVAASSIGEELFYRVDVQGALSDMFLRGTQMMTDSRGMASLFDADHESVRKCIRTYGRTCSGAKWSLTELKECC
ncbi:unnamed protein product [Microthlaspi erraticum]|uniref:Uncharacterized protein n=1 Tax=Microthlaspi erraticum TaxID=1685480 RepID=A0A6D2KUE6_9BRAS|nr:unnamed protein product [Microthlaspi erraticum]